MGAAPPVAWHHGKSWRRFAAGVGCPRYHLCMDQEPTAAFAWVLPIAVALIPAVGGFLASLLQRESSTPRPIRWLTHLTAALAKAPEDSAARHAIDGLIVDYVKLIQPALTTRRERNVPGIVAAVFVAAVSVAAMFGLTSWILVAGDLAVVAWIVTVVIGLFILVLNAAAWIAASKSPRVATKPAT